MALRHETAEAEDVSELKRETLAYLGEEAGSSRSNARTPRPIRNVEEDEGELEYVVHRDGGRRVMELPPRYEELNWEEGNARAGNQQGGVGRGEAQMSGERQGLVPPSPVGTGGPGAADIALPPSPIVPTSGHGHSGGAGGSAGVPPASPGGSEKATRL